MPDMEPGGKDRDALLAQMRRGAIEHLILALLRKEEHYAPELVHVLAGHDGMLTSEGTIYPLLSRLRRDGLVSTTWRESPSGPPRRYYQLTEAGQRALERFIHEWRRFATTMDVILEIDR
jgi:PadR family transcriptional regulator PadR